MLEKEQRLAYQKPDLYAKYSKLEKLFEQQLDAKGDFSERLMRLVDRLIEHFPEHGCGKFQHCRHNGCHLSNNY